MPNLAGWRAGLLLLLVLMLLLKPYMALVTLDCSKTEQKHMESKTLSVQFSSAQFNSIQFSSAQCSPQDTL